MQAKKGYHHEMLNVFAIAKLVDRSNVIEATQHVAGVNAMGSNVSIKYVGGFQSTTSPRQEHAKEPVTRSLSFTDAYALHAVSLTLSH